MSGVAFLNAAKVYSGLCVFDVQERVMKNQKKAFFDAYCSFRQYGDAGDILRLLVRIRKEAPHADLKISDWVQKHSFVQKQGVFEAEEVLELAISYNETRHALWKDDLYFDYQAGKGALLEAMVELADAGVSLKDMKRLLRNSDLAGMIPRVEKLYKYVEKYNGSNSD